MRNVLFYIILAAFQLHVYRLDAQEQGDVDRVADQSTIISEADSIILKTETIESAWKTNKFDEVGGLADDVRVQAIRGLALDRSGVTRTLIRQSASLKSLEALLGLVSDQLEAAKNELIEADAALSNFEGLSNGNSYYDEATERLKSELDILDTFSKELEQIVKTQGPTPPATQTQRIKEIASELNGNRITSLGFSDEEQSRLTATELKARIDERIKEAGAEALELERQLEIERKALNASKERAASRLALLELDEGQLRVKFVDLQKAGLRLEELLLQMDEIGGELLQTELGDRDYTNKATIVFGGLVALVIAGFFWIAIRTDGVSSAIFGGDRGIQFITLFSLVIAIILFGILGILESKELSALLGGLSGYILGKSSAINIESAPERQTNQPTTAPPTQTSVQ